jgi:hypothetical protein
MQGRLSVFMPRRIDIGATIEEESHNICMIAVHRHVQRRLATVVVHIDFNATFQQHLNYWYATTLKGSCKELVHYGSIRPVYVGAAIQQESRDFVTAMVRSCVQYRLFIIVLCMNVGAAIHQELRDFDTFTFQSKVQWRPSMYIPCTDVGAMIQQESDNLDTLKGHGFVQRRLFA